MQQKVQFIVTIIHQPRLLIFDEPFSGFDPINTSLLKKEILKLKNQGATIIFSTHDMGSVEELCDRITLINKSKSILEGDIKEIKRTYQSNTYEIGLKGDMKEITTFLDNNFDLAALKAVDDHFLARITLKENRDDNRLLSTILPHFQVISFNEVIPGMNEIFIKVVQDAQKN
jgi:ABC-2 type transport system ATP-binding protein